MLVARHWAATSIYGQGTSEGEFLLLSHRADVGADGFTERLHIKTYPKRLKGSFPWKSVAFRMLIGALSLRQARWPVISSWSSAVSYAIRRWKPAAIRSRPCWRRARGQAMLMRMKRSRPYITPELIQTFSLRSRLFSMSFADMFLTLTA